MKKLDMNAVVVRRALYVFIGALLFAPPVRGTAQEAETSQRTRTPARMLPAERADILLLPRREATERPDVVMGAMELQDGDVVADVGAGLGYYSLKLAERIAPHGVVFAIDIQQGMLDRLVERMREANVANIYPLLGGEEDTNLPPGKIDWVLLVDAYHEFSRPEAMLASIRASLAPDGRVALVEYRAEGEEGSLERIPASHKMSNEDVMKEWTAAGFELVERIDSLPAQHLFIFKSAGGAVSAADAWHRNLRVASLELGQVPNLSSFGDAIYFSGQPTAADIDLFAGRGVKTVINLRSAQEMQSLDFDEKALVEKAGMNYVHVPMGRDVPGKDDLERILSHLDNAGSDRVLLHCGSSNRVGLIWSVFRSVRHGLGLEEALADGKAAGMASSTLQARAREYISKTTNP